MSGGVYRVTEVIGTSPESWEAAARNAVETAGNTIRDLRVAEATRFDVTSRTARWPSIGCGSTSRSSTKPGTDPRAARRLRLAEILASVSLATDLGTGQPLGHALRTCALATALAEELGCIAADVRTIHQFSLLRFLGCTADAAETAASATATTGRSWPRWPPAFMGSGPELLGGLVRGVAADQPTPRRVRLSPGRSPSRGTETGRSPRTARWVRCSPGAPV